MTELGKGRSRPTSWLLPTGLLLSLAGGGVAAGCGDDDPSATGATTSGTTTASASGGSGGDGGTGAQGAAGGAGGAGGQGGSGGGPDGCTTTAVGATRGSAIALSPDDSRIVVANRDVGSVTVLAVDWTDMTPVMTKVAELAVGGEPWQVAIDGCGTTAYVILRKDQKVVEITDLGGRPAIGGEVAVGSEPTGFALTPNNRSLYVANWVDGTLTVVDAQAMTVEKTLDLNATLAGTGLLGDTVSAAKSRPALAHPRSVAITNNGDGSDDDETVVVTEFFGQRTGPEGANGVDADANKKGLVYSVKIVDDALDTIDLAPLAITGFKDTKNADTGCFPNQLQSVTINGNFAYVTAVCASPEGPIGIFQKGACANDSQCPGGLPGSCQANGSCLGSCVADADCGFGSPMGTCTNTACAPIATNVKTTTHPVVYVLDVTTGAEVASATANLNKRWQDLYDTAPAVPDDGTRRMPLVANDVSFVANSGVAYVSANGTDAVFRVKYDPATSAIQEVGAPGGNNFINLAPANFAEPDKGRLPMGIAVAHDGTKPFAFVANDTSRNVSALALTTQIVFGGDVDPPTPRVAETSPQPSAAADQALLRGKRFFNTGLGRWSLRGQGWGACQSCHIDGQSDNVTWYFARGPRQSTSLDGTFASNDPTDQRILNWTSIFDEMHDFELNTRGVSGGVGALVSANNNPPTNADRINIASPALFPPNGAAGLNGSTEEVTNVNSVLKDWNEINEYTKTIRSPRAPSNLDMALVTAGETLFQDLMTGGRCQGCHGGAKWTVSTRFFTPGGATNAALVTKAWDGAALTAAGFPAALLPATAGNQFMRFTGGPPPNPGAFDQIQCMLRNVGTFAVSPSDVGVAEVRADMTTLAQGNQANGNGYNPPSLLGMSVGAPFFHAGNARTLEESLDSDFGAHWKGLTQNVNFLAQAGDVDKLVAYILSIDEDKAVLPLPAAAGAEGGDFCAP